MAEMFYRPVEPELVSTGVGKAFRLQLGALKT